MTNPINKFYFLLPIGIFILIGYLVFSNNPSLQTPLRVGSLPWIGYEILFLARSLGHIENSPVHLVELSSATEVMHALKNDALEIAMLTLDEALVLKSIGVDLAIITVLDFSSGADAIVAAPKYESLRDLKGQRIGVESTATGAVLLDGALENIQMQTSDFIIVPLTVNKHEKAFLEKKIDAVVTFDPVKSNLLSQGAVTLFDSSQIEGRIVDVLVVRRSILKAHSSAVCALVKAQFRALDYFQRYPQEAVQLMSPRLHVTPESLLISYQGITIPDLDKNRHLLSEPSVSMLTSTKQLAEIMFNHGLLKHIPDLNNLFDSRCIKGNYLE